MYINNRWNLEKHNLVDVVETSKTDNTFFYTPYQENEKQDFLSAKWNVHSPHITFNV